MKARIDMQILINIVLQLSMILASNACRDMVKFDGYLYSRPEGRGERVAYQAAMLKTYTRRTEGLICTNTESHIH